MFGPLSCHIIFPPISILYIYKSDIFPNFGVRVRRKIFNTLKLVWLTISYQIIFFANFYLIQYKSTIYKSTIRTRIEYCCYIFCCICQNFIYKEGSEIGSTMTWHLGLSLSNGTCTHKISLVARLHEFKLTTSLASKFHRFTVESAL